MQKYKIKKIIKDNYSKIAISGISCCGSGSLCCGDADVQEINKKAGYSKKDLKIVSQKSNLGLGCGNPVAFASLKKNEIVLDLGSGAGFDCFLASKKVGSKGKVIGIDMTPEMVKKAKENAKKGNYKNIEFKLGEIEKIPLPDNYVDVVMSNCVINLSPEKEKVFKEIKRVLKEGGRMIISDMVLKKKLPAIFNKSIEALVGCISGAILKKDYIALIKKIGLRKVKILKEIEFSLNPEFSGYISSITISAVK